MRIPSHLSSMQQPPMCHAGRATLDFSDKEVMSACNQSHPLFYYYHQIFGKDPAIDDTHVVSHGARISGGHERSVASTGSTLSSVLMFPVPL
jgi:hypothetical protein